MDHGLLMENLLDLAHAPFTHTTTFAKGWPVPGERSAAAGRARRTHVRGPAARGAGRLAAWAGCPADPAPARAFPARCPYYSVEAVRFHASNLLDGRWDPYPIGECLAVWLWARLWRQSNSVGQQSNSTRRL